MAAEKTRFVDIVTRLINGREISYDEFMFHLDVQNANLQSGTPVGRKLPSFTLPDPSGRLRTVADLSGPNGLLLVFVRSVVRCPYCRNQLAELSLSLDDVTSRGIHVAAVTVDDAELVQQFANHAGVRYALLVDKEAEVIERLGILNFNVPKESPAQNHGRIPFPGHYLVAPDGTVLDKNFTDDLRHRPSAVDLVFRQYGPGRSSVSALIDAEPLGAEIILGTGHALNGQDIPVLVNFKVKPGWHVYGAPASAGYTAIALEFDDERLARQSIVFPEPQRLRLEAIGETLPVHDGEFSARGTVRLKWSPPQAPHLDPLHERLREFQTPPGRHALRGTLHFQACDDSTCLMPESLRFEIPIEIDADATQVRPFFPMEIARAGESTGKP